MLRRVSWNTQGNTAVEYAVVAGLIAVVLMATMSLFGQRIADNFVKIGVAVEGMPDEPSAIQ